MRKELLFLIGAVVFVDTIFYAALAPILPSLSDELDIGKAGAGVLVGALAAGTFAGAIPGGWAAARYGARATVLTGLALMTAAGLAFAFGRSLAMLDAARFLQGLGGALSWTAGLAWIAQETDVARRGEALGVAMGAAVFGAQFGPVVGSVAEWIGRAPAFAGTAVLGLVLIAWAVRTPEGPGALVEAANPPKALLRDRPYLRALWITALPSTAFGAIEVLAPLRLDDLGASATAIGAIFFVAAFAEALVSPVVGRFTDRSGVRPILRAAPLAAAAGLALLAVPQQVLVLSLVLVLTCAALGALWVPGGRLVSLRTEALDVDQGWGFAFNNVSWAAGIAVGSAAGGALAAAFGDLLPYLLIAGLCLMTALAFGFRPERSVRSTA